jgi:hypothetical protein
MQVVRRVREVDNRCVAEALHVADAEVIQVVDVAVSVVAVSVVVDVVVILVVSVVVDVAVIPVVVSVANGCWFVRTIMIRVEQTENVHHVQRDQDNLQRSAQPLSILHPLQNLHQNLLLKRVMVFLKLLVQFQQRSLVSLNQLLNQTLNK